MDRPRRPEPNEPDVPSGQAPTPDAPVERTVPDPVDNSPDPEPHLRQGVADSAERTVEERAAASTGPDKDSPDSRLDEVQEDQPDRPSTRPADDAAEVVDQRRRRDEAATENPQTSGEAASTVHDAADRVPANMHEKMLQSPVFTRLGWGSSNDADSKDDDDDHLRSREPREQAVDPERRQNGGETELTDGSDPATRNGDPACLDTESHDGTASSDEQSKGDSAGAGPETPAVADAPNQADEIAVTPEDRALDSEARDDPKSIEQRSDIELADQHSVEEADTVATAGADEEQRHRFDGAVDTESTVQGAGEAATANGESPTTRPDDESVTEDRKVSETSLPTSNSNTSDRVQPGGGDSGATTPLVRRLIENPPQRTESTPIEPPDSQGQSDIAPERQQPQNVGEVPGGPIKLSTSNRGDRRALNRPAADSTIVVDEKFTYHTDEHRRVVSASATLTVVDLDHPRNNYAQRTLAGKLPGDHAGHLFARIFQGPGHKVNLTPMEGLRVNKKEFDTMEREWRHAIQQGKEVEVFVELDYPDKGPRPEYISVVYKIDGKSYTRDIKNTPMERKDDSSA